MYRAALRHDHYSKAVKRGRDTALILPNALVRGAVTAICWLSPPPYPHTVVATEAEGRAWLEGHRRNL